MSDKGLQKSVKHNPVAIANYFISKSVRSLTVMQILKLAYIAHGFKLGLSWGAMSKEPAQAWKFGPVFPSVYHQFKRQYPYDIQKQGEDEHGHIISSTFDEHDTKVLDLVYDLYGEVEAWRLSNLTHKEGTPWHTAYHKNGGSMTRGVDIDDREIMQHFKVDVINRYNIKGLL